MCPYFRYSSRFFMMCLLLHSLGRYRCTAPALLDKYGLVLVYERISSLVHEITAVVIDSAGRARCIPSRVCENDAAVEIVYHADDVSMVGEYAFRPLHDLAEVRREPLQAPVVHHRVIPYLRVALACDEPFKCLHHFHHPPRKPERVRKRALRRRWQPC